MNLLINSLQLCPDENKMLDRDTTKNMAVESGGKISRVQGPQCKLYSAIKHTIHAFVVITFSTDKVPIKRNLCAGTT